ncbi:hypothetical protein [Marinobacterium sp. BA1]|uniref:hypothetical protein n=1 Tax=Marinobacterium sp. BA1 TaxID=3138931 RepID=UPI0032E78809
MAVIFYPKGALGSGFVGYRAVTTLGSEDQYAQKWFSLNDYSPQEAKRLAESCNRHWRQKAESVAADKQLNFTRWNSIEDVPGLWAQLRVERKMRATLRAYVTPCFVVCLRKSGKSGQKLFRISPDRRDYLSAWEEACRLYTEIRGLPEEAIEHLFNIMPDPCVFYNELYYTTPGVQENADRQLIIDKAAY